MHDMIDFTKYLNCDACKLAGLYCPEHRIEVEKKLFITKGIKENDEPAVDG